MTVELLFPLKRCKWLSACIHAVVLLAIMAGCAHYPINKSVEWYNPQAGYRGSNLNGANGYDDLLMLVTFSGGGTRAAAFSYGVLETMRDTEVSIRGRKQRLLDQVDMISGVSGGSFTAAYYGLFRDRIFGDFESKFLKKNVQGDLTKAILLNPINWGELFSAYYGRSDLAAEYYDKNVFDGATFGDLIARGKPMIVINATDMVHGTRFSFNQDTFDAICSDLPSFPIARACAASSAVPIVLTPITLRNYAGTCGYQMPESLKQAMEPPKDMSSRRFDLANSLLPFLNLKKKPVIHLVDGGVADNLGLRALLERITLMGNAWTTLQNANLENAHKIVFVIVNAETELDDKWDRLFRIPSFGAMLESYSSIAISRYNVETVALLRESFSRWSDEIRKGRCGSGKISTEPGSCGDIQFYLVEVNFNALGDETESSYLKKLPTSFVLQPDDVDKLKDAAHRILGNSKEFQRLINDLH